MTRNAPADRVEGIVYRAARIGSDAIIDDESRTVRISFSSEIPVLRQSFWEDPWIEVLGHKADEVDLSEINDGGTLHYNHRRTREDRIGSVRKAWIKNSRGEADIQLSAHERVNDIWQDIKDEHLRNISVGYHILKRTLTVAHDDAPDEFRVSWLPLELSVVDIPADRTVGLGRNLELMPALRFPGMPEPDKFYRIISLGQSEGRTMTGNRVDNSGGNDNGSGGGGAGPGAVSADLGGGGAGPGAVSADLGAAGSAAQRAENAAGTSDGLHLAGVVDIEDVRNSANEAGRMAGVEEGRTQERTRHAEIRTTFEPFAGRLANYDELLQANLADANATADTARSQILGLLAANTPGIDSSRVDIDQDNSALARAITDGMILRAGIATKEQQSELNGDFRGHTLVEMARQILESGGVSTRGLPKRELVARAFTGSDFPLIIADVANKSVLKGFMEAPETWLLWAQVGNLSDFKPALRVGLSSFSDLPLVREDGEIKYGTYGEQGEQIQLATYAAIFRISRESIINDDAQAFTGIPSGMGRSASRMVGNLAYGVLVTNPNMRDGIPFFDAAHGNDLAAGGPPSRDQIKAMRVGMGTQTDESGSAAGLNIRPAYLVCPLALEDEARDWQVNITEPGQSNAAQRNPYAGTFETVADARLDADSALKWYMSAPQQFDTVEVAFLDGQQTPLLEQQAGWKKNGVEFKVLLDAASAPTEYRTWQRNPGE